MLPIPLDAISEEQQWLKQLGLPQRNYLQRQRFTGPVPAHSFLSPASWYRTEARDPVRVSDLLNDLPWLKLAMEAGYAAWELLANRGWDWDDFFDRWTVALRSQTHPTLTAVEAFGPFQLLVEYQLDNHTGVALPGVTAQHYSRSFFCTSGSQEAVSAVRNGLGQIFQMRAGDPANRLRETWLFENSELRRGYAFSCPSWYGAVEAVKSGGEWMSVTPAENGAACILPAVYNRLSDEVAYLRISSLSPEANEHLASFREWLPSDVRTAETLIIDVRGNQGGMHTGVLAMLHFITGQPVALSTTLRRKRSWLTPALTWGFLQHKYAHLQHVAGPLQKYLRRAFDDLFAPPPPQTTFGEYRSPWCYGQHRFPSGRPRIIVVADNASASDGEALVYMLAAIPDTLVVGSDTAGVGEFTNPGYFILPYTRIPFRIAMGISDIYGDGRSFEGYGLNPDILIPQLTDREPPQLLRLREAVIAAGTGHLL